jgi:hypothetical protein
VCDPDDGVCYECVSATDCGQGQSCFQHACTTVSSWCQTCSTNSDCSSNCLCLGIVDGGPQQCISACLNTDDCNPSGGYGFTCQTGLCLPAPNEIALCVSISALGGACNGDMDCLNAGLPGGICEWIDGSQQGVCTVSCDPHNGNSDCPGGWQCDSDTSASRYYCHP